MAPLLKHDDGHDLPAANQGKGLCLLPPNGARRAKVTVQRWQGTVERKEGSTQCCRYRQRPGSILTGQLGVVWSVNPCCLLACWLACWDSGMHWVVLGLAGTVLSEASGLPPTLHGSCCCGAGAAATHLEPLALAAGAPPTLSVRSAHFCFINSSTTLSTPSSHATFCCKPGARSCQLVRCLRSRQPQTALWPMMLNVWCLAFGV